ncbi:MAG TPA: MFS transporter [Candidatus Sulfotelmatobacter sp.]|nr:MFS transporter [Candidatus Sulfotelmatobacter sp.]
MKAVKRGLDRALRRLRGGRLWGHPDFTRLWVGQAVSELGSQVTSLALPTAAIFLLHAGAIQLGIIGALDYLPFLLIGLVAGVMVDRLRRRPVLIAADLGRFVCLASIPVTFAAGHLTLLLVYAVALLTGICTVFFDVAYQSYLPALVGPGNLVEGNSKLTVSDSLASLAGPALAGILIQLLGAARAVALDAGSYLVSVGSLWSIQSREAPPARESPRRAVADEIWEGLRFVFGNRVLRNITACGTTHNLGAIMVRTLLLLFAYRQLGLTPTAVGLVLAVGSGISLLGAVAAGPATRSWGVGPTLVATQILTGVAYLLIPLATLGAPLLWIGLSQLLLGLQRSVFNIVQVSLRQAVTPDAMRGRMTASIRTVIWGVYPIGALLGGALGTRLGLTPTIAVGGLLSLLASAWLLAPSVRTVREHPGQTRQPA